MSPDPKEVTTLRSVPIHALPIVAEDYPLWDLLHLFQVWPWSQVSVTTYALPVLY